MSNQRSFVLFVALVIIVSYLYYESFLKKQDSLGPLNFNELSDLENQKYKVLNKRNLLYSTDETEVHQITSKQVLERINKNPDNKRRKRETPTDKEFLNWRFNVNITEVEGGSMNSFESSDSDAPKVMKSEKKPLSMAIYISGQDEKNSNTKLQRSWGAVGEFLRNFFGSSPKQLKENHDVFIEGRNFLNQVIKSEDSSDKRKENLSGKDKKPKFLSLLGGGGGNKENPPMELGSGEIDSLAFETSNISSQIVNVTDQESFTIKNLEPEEIFAPKMNFNPTTGILETDLNAVIETITDSLNFPETDKDLETNDSTDLEVSNKDTSAVFNVDTNLPGENSSNQLESFCLHLLKNVAKSPKFVEFAESEGSGNFKNEDSSVNSELNGNQLEVTTQTSSPAPQLNALQNLWNRIRFRFRNGKSVNEIFTPTSLPPENTDLEGTQNRFFNGFFNGFGSGSRLNDEAEEINFLLEKQAVQIPEEFSIQDCRNFFTIKEESESSTQNMVFTEPTMQPEVNFSSFEMNKTFLSGNLLRDVHIKDNKSLIEEVNTNEIEDFKNSLETTITAVDSIIQLEEKIQEVIDSIGKGDAFETPDTTLTPIVTEQPRKKLSSKSLIGTTVEEINIFETSTIFTDSFEKSLNDTDALILENANLNKINEELFSEDYTNEESFIGNEKENIKNTVMFENTLSPLNESKQRIFNLFMSGSGSRELTDTEISTLDLNTDDEPLGMFDLGSGERKMDELELFSNHKDADETTISELSRFDFSKISTDTITEIDNLDYSTAINLRSNVDSITTAPHETEINGTVLRISDSEEGREIVIQAYLDPNELSCINCSNDETLIQEVCPNCEEIFLNPNTIDETVNPLISNDSEIIESYLNYDNEVFSDTNINIVIPPTIPPKLISSSSSTQQSGLAQMTQICSNCENVDTETLKAEFPQYQNIDSPHRMNFSSENLSNISTTKFEEWSSNEENVAELPHQFDSKVSITNTTLSNFKENQFNNSRTRYARFNDEVPETPVSRRGARAHIKLPDNRPDLTSEQIPEKSSIEPSTSTRSTKVEETDRNSPKVSTISYAVSAENTDYIGAKVSDTANDTLMVFPDLFSDFASSSKDPADITEYRSTTEQFQLPHNVIDVSTPETVRSDLNTNPRANIPVKKFCLSASECDSTLNERCISKDSSTTCDCGRTFKRHPESRKCEATITVKTSLKLPGEQFHIDLKNKNSELFRQKKQQSLETMWMLLGHDPELFLTVAEIDVDEFEDGSLVINWDIKMVTDRNETVSELTNQIDNELKEVLGNSNLLRNLPLNVQNASVSTLAVNPCAKSELNYCHKSAECILDEIVGFTCKCKKGYIDNSNDKSYPGEVCIEFCSPGECGDHGECKLTLKGEKHCLCSGWYFGGKCEISGIVVIASFAGANILVLTLLLVVCVCRKRRNRSYYNRNLTRFQPTQDMCNSEMRIQRISDAVALDEIRASKMSKYANISTPLSEQGPVIQITSPSFPGSSIDYDSTFDRSPCSSEEISIRESGGTVSKV